MPAGIRRVSLEGRVFGLRTTAAAKRIGNAQPFPSLVDAEIPETQVNDFVADAIISQLLLLDAKDAKKVRRRAESRSSEEKRQEIDESEKDSPFPSPSPLSLS